MFKPSTTYRAFSVSLAVMFAASSVLAAGGSTSNTAAYSGNNVAPTTTATATSSTTATTSTATSNPTVANGALNQGTNTGAKEGGGINLGVIAAGIAGGFAVAYAPKCFSEHDCSKFLMAVAGIGISMAIASQMSKAKSASGLTVGAVSLKGLNDPYLHNPDKRVQDTPGYADVVGATNQLKKMGYNVNLKNGNITTPKGKTYTPSDFSSPAAMAAAGISPADQATFASMMGDITKKAQEKLGVDKAEDSSSGADMTVTQRAGGLGEASDLAALGSGAEKFNVNRDPSQVAGLSKNLNGDPIGVAADSIFGMMNRRYDVVAKSCQVLVNKTCP